MKICAERAALTLLGLAVFGCGDGGTGSGEGSRIPPSVVSLIPAPGQADVGILDTLRVVMDQDLDPSSIPGALAVESGSRTVRGELSLEGARTLRFVPASPMDFGEEYRARVGNELKSLRGRKVVSPPEWTFATQGDPVPLSGPVPLSKVAGVLAHDSMKGRGSGTEDEAAVAQYLASLMEAADLQALDGVRVQPFSEIWEQDGSTVSSQNVLGVVPGWGALADEWVVVGAHYDHLGMLEKEGGTLEVYNGADDNASGTAVLTELGRLFASYASSGGMEDLDRRSVLFAAWGAEEKGRLGSCHFTDSGLLPLSRVGAVVNLDMVGRLRMNVAEALGWESSPAWQDLLHDANRPGIGFENTSVCQSCSDHACFRKEGIPYLWFFTGWHDEYNTPEDDAHLLNHEGMADILEVAFRVTVRLAVMKDPPAFRAGGL